MAVSEHPHVFFPTTGEGDMNIGWGYLSIINGVPWLAASLEDARSRDQTKMILLDPQLLEGPKNDGGEFHYRGELRPYWK